MSQAKTAVRYLKVEEGYDNQRIDNFLINHLKGVPKSHIYRILRKGEVRVNKKRAKPSYRLQTDDEIRVPPITLSETPTVAKPGKSLIELLKQRILYEDDRLFILNKPSGVPVHGGTSVGIGVIEALRVIYPKLPQLELVHRLDMDTSGCLVLAKKRSALREIHELLRSGKVDKKYLALTKGHWKASELRVEEALQKNFLSSGERVVRVNKEGKPSITQFKVIESFADADLVEATLLTGRTHQIRVHAQHRGHPLAGDDKYGNKEFTKLIREQTGLKRLFLHAKLIEFVLPSSGKKISVTAPLDEDLERCLKSLAFSPLSAQSDDKN